MEEQREMFAPPVRNTRHSEPRPFHHAVLYLRCVKSMDVYRVSGRQASVNGRLVTNQQVVSIARQLGWRDGQ